MNPFLTTQGKWLFLTGLVFSLVGALVREPVLILFGQIPVFVLAMSLVWLLPAARVGDRRVCRFRIEHSEDRAILTLRRGKEALMRLWFENHSPVRLRLAQLQPVVAGGVTVADAGLSIEAGPRQARHIELDVTTQAIGRSSLQGFDVVIEDRWGLIALRDYLPCVQVFETFPEMEGMERRQAHTARPLRSQSRVSERQATRSGVDLRELREFQPGDPLRTVAWKATVRQRRLISREFEEERSRAEFVALDISSSMRAGVEPGQKFDHSLQLAAHLSSLFLEQGCEVGLISFDADVYGLVDVGTGREHLRKIQWHLVGLNSVVDAGRTALDDEGVEQQLSDYLLVHERLDFRRGKAREVDSSLLNRWLKSVIVEEKARWKSNAEAFAVVDEELSPARRYLRLRGVPLAPPAEVRPGTKASGLKAVLSEVLRKGRSGAGRLTVISDLCALNDLDALERPISQARRKGLVIEILAPFSPWFLDSTLASEAEEVDDDDALMSDLFARAERSDRLEVAQRLERMGIKVRFFGPRTSSTLPTL